MARESFPEVAISPQHPKLSLSQTNEWSPSHIWPSPISALSQVHTRVCGFHLLDPFTPSLSRACHCRPLLSFSTPTTAYTLVHFFQRATI